ncbi:MAG: type II toxin-antitoxin system VapC family toxin [Arenicellales bacterium]
MIIVLDASAAVEIDLNRPQSKRLSDSVLEAEWVIAPTIYIAETSNVMGKYHQHAGLPLKDCEQHLEQLMALPDDFINEETLFREAFSLSCSLAHSVYDMLYLVLARRNNATILSMDKKLQALAAQIGVSCV